MSKPKQYDERHRLEDVRAHVEDLTATAQALRELGAEEDLPAVERNAKRLEAVVDILERTLPPEVGDGE